MLKKRLPGGWWGPLCGAVLALAAGACTGVDAPGRQAEGPGEGTGLIGSLAVGPSAETLLVGDSQQLTALPKDARGRAVRPREVVWTSLAPEIATVSATGLVSGVAAGTVRIVATSDGREGTAVITVWATSARTAECDTPRPEWLWCDDFEHDRLRSYFEYASADGSFVRAAGVGYGGSTGMRARFGRTGQVFAGFLHLAIGKTPWAYFRPVDDGTARHREIYWRHLVKMESGWIGGGGNKLSRAQTLVNRNWAQAMMAHVWSGVAGEGEPDRLGIVPATTVDRGGRVLGTEYNDFPRFQWLGVAWSRTPLFDRAHVGKWHCIEAHVRLDDPGRANGVFELWVDGALEARLDGIRWHGMYADYGINTVFLENYWNGGAPQPQERYFDNFVVSTGRIGC